MPAAVAEPDQLIIIAASGHDRFTSSYREWNGQWTACAGHDHLTRADALTCAEERLRYRA